jgi:hypothetical protein
MPFVPGSAVAALCRGQRFEISLLSRCIKKLGMHKKLNGSAGGTLVQQRREKPSDPRFLMNIWELWSFMRNICLNLRFETTQKLL